MANRRLQNKEIERKKKQNKNTAKAIGIVAAFLLVLIAGWIIWDVYDRRFVITFNDTRIPTSELQVFLDMVGRTPETRVGALMELVGTIATLERAEQLGVSINDEDREFLLGWITDQRAAGNDFRRISDDRIIDLFSTQMLHPLIAEIEFPDDLLVLDIDEEELMEDFLQALEDEFISDYDIQVFWIAHDDLAYLDEILSDVQAVESSDGFIDLIFRHCMWQYSLDEIIPTPLDAIYFSFEFDEEILNALIALEPGEVSQIIRATDETNFIIYIVSKEPLDKDELFENFKANTLQNMRFEAFFNQLPIWVDEARERMDINERAVERA